MSTSLFVKSETEDVRCLDGAYVPFYTVDGGRRLRSRLAFRKRKEKATIRRKAVGGME